MQLTDIEVGAICCKALKTLSGTIVSLRCKGNGIIDQLQPCNIGWVHVIGYGFKRIPTLSSSPESKDEHVNT